MNRLYHAVLINMYRACVMVIVAEKSQLVSIVKNIDESYVITKHNLRHTDAVGVLFYTVFLGAR